MFNVLINHGVDTVNAKRLRQLQGLASVTRDAWLVCVADEDAWMRGHGSASRSRARHPQLNKQSYEALMKRVLNPEDLLAVGHRSR